MDLFGVRILGLNTETLWKLVLTLIVVAAVLAFRRLLKVVIRTPDELTRRSIWVRKYVRLAIGALGFALVLSIWFDNPQRLATVTGLVAAGAAVASQNAILSIAGYFVIVFGKAFNLGDRIQIGDVRGDVLDIGLFKTTVMEMGVPIRLHPDPNHWVGARQYSGRVVVVPNSEVFKKPTYNYTASFDFLWDELQIPIPYGTDLRQAETIVLEAARAETDELVEQGRAQLEVLKQRFLLHESDLAPSAYVRLTDNWIELSVRFMVHATGIRNVKDRISRRILARFEEAGIGIASSTFELTKLPPLELRLPREEEQPRESAPH